MNDKPDPFQHTKRDDRKEAIRRADEGHKASKAPTEPEKGLVARFFEKLLD